MSLTLIQPLRHQLDPVLQQEIDSFSHICTLQRGEILFHQGTAAEAVYLILAGCLRVLQHTEGGQDVCFRIIAPGEFCGLVALTSIGGTFPGTGQALKETIIQVIPAYYLRLLIADSPALAQFWMDMLITRLTVAQDMVREMAAEPADRRLARTLLRLAQKLGRDTPQGCLLDLPLARQDLAELVGSRIETVCRILKRWEKMGWLLSGREQIILCDPEALQLVTDSRE